MAQANLGAASQQTAWMLQKVNADVQISENLDMAGDSLFSQAPTEEIGLQQYRHPIEIEVGGIAGYYQPDGGSYFQGQANQVDQMIVAPLPIMVAISATELARRIAKGGRDITVDNWIARMISKVKDKTAHTRNAYLQGYNNGLLATIITRSTATSFPVTPPFGGRLLDRNGYYQVTDANFNVVGNINVLDLEKNGVGTTDTATVDAVPGRHGKRLPDHPDWSCDRQSHRRERAGLHHLGIDRSGVLRHLPGQLLRPVSHLQRQRRVPDPGHGVGVYDPDATGSWDCAVQAAQAERLVCPPGTEGVGGHSRLLEDALHGRRRKDCPTAMMWQ